MHDAGKRKRETEPQYTAALHSLDEAKTMIEWFRIYREKVQNSRSAFTGWENSICPSRVAWLPPLWVPPVFQAQILCGNLCTSTEPVGPSCVHTNFSPILQRLAVGHSWPLRSLRLVKSFVSCCPLRRLPSLGDHQSG